MWLGLVGGRAVGRNGVMAACAQLEVMLGRI